MDEQKLYIMKNSFGLIKIGISKDPETRANTLRLASGSAIDVLEVYKCKNARELEQHLHEVFKESRLEGEWFEGVSTKGIVREGRKFTEMVVWEENTDVKSQREHTLSQTYLPDGYLNVTDASKMLGIARKTMYAHINSGKLKRDYYYGRTCVSISELETTYGAKRVLKANNTYVSNKPTTSDESGDTLFKLRRENAILKDRIKIIQDLLGNIDTDSGL